jgi:tyrosyl-tRNA synthetase
MSNEEKIELISRNLEEVLTHEELKRLVESGTPLRHYIGFEISGKLHIGHFYQLLKVKDLQDAGAETIIWLADLHSAINEKLDGNLETIKKIANEYFIPATKELFAIIGGDPEKLDFRLCSEEYAKNPEIWQIVLEVGKATTMSRVMRSITIMGREQSEGIDSAKLMYPLMQAADVFLLGANIAQAGIDQRKVHVIAIDAAMQVKTSALKDGTGNQIKPIALHTPILLGLNTNEAAENVNSDMDADEIAMKMKMSKSKADSAVSVHDSEDEIRLKLNKAFCPEGIVEFNPVLDWVKRLILENGGSLEINRPEKWGGDLNYTNYELLEDDFRTKKLHPQDLKAAVAEWLIRTLKPIRQSFEADSLKLILNEVTTLSTKKS